MTTGMRVIPMIGGVEVGKDAGVSHLRRSS
jgi:hypothetical protein